MVVRPDDEPPLFYAWLTHGQWQLVIEALEANGTDEAKRLATDLKTYILPPEIK